VTEDFEFCKHRDNSEWCHACTLEKRVAALLDAGNELARQLDWKECSDKGCTSAFCAFKNKTVTAWRAAGGQAQE
jgi:hypothetical protein